MRLNLTGIFLNAPIQNDDLKRMWIPTHSKICQSYGFRVTEEQVDWFENKQNPGHPNKKKGEILSQLCFFI